MTKTITVSNKEMKINKIGETFTKGAFEVVVNDKVIFSADTNKACVMFVAKNKEFTIEVLEEANEAFGITRTGSKMLTKEEEISMGYNVSEELISSFVTVNDKGAEVLVELVSTGKIQYTYIEEGEKTGRTYFINTKEFKYVYEENKRYKNKLPKWLSKEQLKEMY